MATLMHERAARQTPRTPSMPQEPRQATAEDPTELLAIALGPETPPGLAATPNSQGTNISKESRAKALAARRRRAYNGRMKAEMAHLRHQESELSAQLQFLSKRGGRRHVPGGLLTVPTWKGVALLQMEQRLAAEAMNERLRTRVDGQHRMIRELFRLLQQQQQESDDAAGALTRTSSPVKLELADTLLFETYLKELDVMYAQTDDVFRACGLDLEQEEDVVCPHPWQKWDAESETEYWECAGVDVLPLPFHEARLTMWPVSRFFQPRQEQRQFYRGFHDPENTLATKFRVNYRSQTPAATIPLTGRLVMRRYREATRSVLVWRSLYDGENGFEGMHTDETGWCILRATTDRAAIGPGATLVQMCGRFVPSHFTARRHVPNAELRNFSEIVMGSVTVDCAQLVRMMEDLLLA